MTSKFSIWIRQHSVAAYFIVAYIVTWIGVLPLVASAQGIINIQLSPNLHIVGDFGPFLAALIVTAIIGGRQGIGELFGRMLRWRVGITWVLIAVFSPVAIFALSAAITYIFWPTWLDLGQLFEALCSYLRDFMVGVGTTMWLVSSVIISFSYGFLEEPGWRGFALPRLQKTRGARTATVILAIFWGLWHLPFFFYRFDFQIFTIIGFFVSLLFGAIWLTFLYNSTGGSILMVSLWHTFWDIVIILGPSISGNIVFLMNIMVIILAVAALRIGGPDKLSTKDKHII